MLLVLLLRFADIFHVPGQRFEQFRRGFLGVENAGDKGICHQQISKAAVVTFEQVAGALIVVLMNHLVQRFVIQFALAPGAETAVELREEDMLFAAVGFRLEKADQLADRFGVTVQVAYETPPSLSIFSVVFRP